MPSPLGHSLAGASIGALDIWPRRRWAGIALVIFLANLPDVDFLIGYLIGQPASLHWGFTHSISFALLAGLVAGALARPNFLRAAMIATAAVASHLVLDMLIGPAPNPDFGLQLLAPFSGRRFMLPWSVFPSYPNGLIHDDPLAALFSGGIIPLLVREAIVMLPICGVVWAMKLKVHSRKVRC